MAEAGEAKLAAEGAQARAEAEAGALRGRLSKLTDVKASVRVE